MSALDEVCALLTRVENALPSQLESDDLESVEELTRKMQQRGGLLTQLAAMNVSGLPPADLTRLRARVQSVVANDARLAASLDAYKREIAARSRENVRARAAMRGYASAARPDVLLGQERKA